MASSDVAIEIAVALIGAAGSVGAAMITRPRPAPAVAPSPTPEPAMQMAGTYRMAPEAPGRLQAVVSAGRVKISRALWWGIVACLGAVGSSFALAWACGLVGIFLAVRDIRSPGTRRLVWWALAISSAALVIAMANPHTGFLAGFSQGYNSSN